VTEFTKNMSVKSLLSEIRQISKLLWNKGWAEVNAGNFSINITELHGNINFIHALKGGIRPSKTFKNLGNNSLLISRSGSKMRDISVNPLPDLCLIHFNESGNLYYNIPVDTIKNKIPTSELTSHFEIHNQLAGTNAEEKAVLHTHPSEIIALTNLKNFKNERVLNKILFSIQPEVSILFPDGIGLVRYLKTGSKKLAIETRKKFGKHKIVIWEKHGCVSIGKNMTDAFDKTDIIAKTISILLMCLSTGNKFEGLNVKQIKELRNLNRK